MIEFEKHILKNGLKVILHKDVSTPLVALNIIYNVGSRDEDIERTGFAHLFEHLMFGGSKNIPKYDEPLERVGGENNAFTNNDYTNYYLTLPKENIETAFWLESDRMNELAFSEKSLEVQRNVVVEEFKQNYLNQPYGDVWHLLRSMVYKKHPYMWPTIGLKPEHIANATMQNVKDFFYQYYRPNNAILVVAGNINFDETLESIKKWFEEIPTGVIAEKCFPIEPPQNKPQFLEVARDVPLNNIYKAFLMSDRKNPRFYAADLMSDILSNGDSSRFTQKLMKEKQLFSSLDAYITGDIDDGMFIIQGTPMKGIPLEEADKAIQQELDLITTEFVDEKELQKVKNKVESAMAFTQVNILNKAMNLCFYEMLGNANDFNHVVKKYFSVTREDVRKEAETIFNENNCSTLYYKSKSASP